nr:NAD-dependent epimerase/dehydratase family protein [Halogeometricum sp. CBA1124]
MRDARKPPVVSQKVAITGGAGFLGSHIVDYFVEQGEDVVVVDDFSSGEAKNLEQSADDVEVRELDLRSEDAIDGLDDIDVVVHLAAKIGGIGYFHHVPADIIAMNDAMNKVVFDAAVEHDFDRVVYASSSMVYERATEFPVTEDQISEIPPPDSAYGFQKLAGEYYCRAYHDQYDVEYSIFRPFNAVGPREPPGEEVGQAHVIPDFVLKILDKEQYPLKILGDGRQVRSFTNVRDIARGVYLCSFEDAAANDHFNLGSRRASACVTSLGRYGSAAVARRTSSSRRPRRSHTTCRSGSRVPRRRRRCSAGSPKSRSTSRSNSTSAGTRRRSCDDVRA